MARPVRIPRVVTVSTALGITLVGVATAAAGASAAGAAGFAVAVAGAVLIAGGARSAQPCRRPALELIGAVGAVVGVLLSRSSTPWLAGTLTALVPLLLIAAVRRTRNDLYAIVAAAAAVGACWAWLAAAGVAVVEAYTLPAAAAALVAGLLVWRSGPARSWLTLGPAIVLVLGPDALGRDRDKTTRRVP